MNHQPNTAFGHSSLAQSLVEHQEFVRRLALRLTGDPSEADDAAQDTWVRALERRPSLSRRLGPWLETSLRGIVRNRRRAAGRRAVHEKAAARPEVASQVAPQVAPVEQLELRQWVVDAVLALDEPYRRTVVMAYQQGLSAAEIAGREGVAAATVRTRLYRAHERLRERIGDAEKHDGLAALAAAPLWGAARAGAVGGKLGGAALGGGVLTKAAGWAALAAAFVAAISLGAWAAWNDAESPSTPALEASPSRAALAAVSSGGESELAALDVAPVVEDSKEQAGERRALVPEGAADWPYWDAVRSTRADLPRYRVPESEASAALRRELEGLSLLNPILPLSVRALESAFGEAAELKDVSLALAPSVPSSTFAGAEWLTAPKAMPMVDWLGLISSLHGADIQWEVLDGSVVLAPMQELVAGAEPFDHRIDDLLLDPAAYFPDGAVPYPLYSSVANANDLCVMLMGGAAEFLPDRETAEVLLEPQAIRWRHSPRSQLHVQRYLDQVRAFRQPLPEQGVSGKRARLHETPSDRAILSILRAAGGMKGLMEEADKTLVERLRALGTQHGVGVLWTSAAREHADAPEQLALGVLCGCLVLKMRDEGFVRQLPVLWMDLRTKFTGQAIDPQRVAEDARLGSLARKGSEPTLTTDFLVAFLQRYVAPESWDQDPRYSMMVSQDSQLTVHQSAWVLDEIERTVNYLAGTASVTDSAR